MGAIARRLTILVTALGFTTTTEWSSNGIDWKQLSLTCTERFPLHIVGRVADRDDYTIFIRVKK